jgi:aspartate racemase
MRTIGLLGGMSWESTVHYYRLINEAVRARLGGLHSAQTLLYSVDFAPLEQMQKEARWDEAGRTLADAAQRLERGGADFVVLCTNTMHKVIGAIEAAVQIPVLHIADATGDAVRARGVRKVGLLGTRFTMEEPFYRERLTSRFGLEVLTPGEADRARVHSVIYEELCFGVTREPSREDFRRIAAAMADAGAEGIILGCTEIMMLLGPDDVRVPVFDTTAIHAHAAVDRALAENHPART